MIRPTNKRGFSLVEILVALVVMGLVVAAVHGTFISTQRHAYTQEEVVEVQQNLRVALDYVAKDIRMARFLAPADETALVNIPPQMLLDDNGDGDYEDSGERPLLSLVSATSMHGYARVTGATASASFLTLDVPAQTMHQFADGDRARVFRPEDLTPVTNIYSVSGTPAGDQVVMDISGGGYVADSVGAGDLLLVIPSGAANSDYPLRIEYQLADDPSSTDVDMNQLQRRVTDRGGNIIQDWELIASKISALSMTYLDNAGGSTTDLDEIVAIQITITGQTDETKLQRNFSGVKQRVLSTTVKIHNGVVL